MRTNRIHTFIITADRTQIGQIRDEILSLGHGNGTMGTVSLIEPTTDGKMTFQWKTFGWFPTEAFAHIPNVDGVRITHVNVFDQR